MLYIHISLAAALAGFLALPGAQAQPVQDRQSGLLLDPPPPYVASRLPPVAPQTARYALRRQDAPQEGCQIAFVPAPSADRARNQAQLNELARSAEWQRLERLRLSQAYDIDEAGPVEIGELTALRLLGRMKPRETMPAGTRSVFTILETPPGRTTLVCAAGSDFAARQPEFEAIARGVHPPR